jgi:Reverse transcriptase (RNA-dependent DNA polymerase)
VKIRDRAGCPLTEVLRVKRGPDGEVQSYRVRIVAGGHRQVEEVNYSETFFTATKMLTVCTVLANAAHQDQEIEHVDIKSAYLNATLKEEIYMKPPRGVLKPDDTPGLCIDTDTQILAILFLLRQ